MNDVNNNELRITNDQLISAIKQKEKESRSLSPANNLDLTFLTTENNWGKAGSITPELKAKLTRIINIIKDPETGEVKAEFEGIWERLGYFTRDLRLSFLDSSSIKRVIDLLDLGGDYLSVDFKEAFIICLSRVASIIEVNQSKKGFLREINNTILQKTTYSGLGGPEKRSLINGQTKKDGGLK